MFQSLRTGSQVYVLHKEREPRIETGTVISVSSPVPKYPVPPVFGGAQEMLVDLSVKIAGQDVSYQKLPASADIADFGTTGIVISDSRDAMNAEVHNLKTKSEEILGSIDYHRDMIEKCEVILSELNPDYADRQKQKTEIEELKQQVSQLVEINRKLMGRLDSGASSS